MPATVTEGYIVVSESTYYRDSKGQFLSKLHHGAEATANEVAEEIANFARAFAPFRTGALKESIKARPLGGHTALAIATADHAAPQETGSRAHPIGRPGQKLINRGEGIYPGWEGTGVVKHRGNRATRFMTKAGTVVKALAPEIIRKHMPSS